jgi:hypothetical protein
MAAMDKRAYRKIANLCKKGKPLRDVLKSLSIPYPEYDRFRRANNLPAVSSRRRPHRVYTLEKVRELKRRYKKGGFLSKLCAEMGMDYKNLCRFCRQQGIKLLDQEEMQENYERRDYSRAGRQSGTRSDRTLKILADLEKGLPMAKIARKHRVSRQWVHYVKTRQGG